MSILEHPLSSQPWWLCRWVPRAVLSIVLFLLPDPWDAWPDVRHVPARYPTSISQRWLAIKLFGLYALEPLSQEWARLPLLLSPESCSCGDRIEKSGPCVYTQWRAPLWTDCIKTEWNPLCPLLISWAMFKKYSSVWRWGGDRATGLCHEMDCCSAFLFKAIRRLGRREMSETSELWQIKLVLEFFSSRSHQERLQNHPKRGLFMNSEFLPVVKCTIDNTLDQWLQGNNSFVPLMLLRYTGTQAFLF